MQKVPNFTAATPAQNQPILNQQSFSTYDSNYYNYPVDNYVKNEVMVGHDLPLPQVQNQYEDANVGSLLRLVYSDPESQNVQNCHELMADYSAVPPILDGISLDYL